MRRAGPLLVLASVLIVPAAARGDAPPRDIAELRARVARILLEEQVPGVGLALVAGGDVVWSGGVGLADREAGRPVGADTLFRVGSVTKTFISLALVKLAEQGRIDLGARVADLAPEIAMENRWADEAPVTVAHLLEHTAGFDDMRPNEMYAPLADEAMPLAAVLARNPRSRRARWRPGAHHSYANPGYTVAGYLIEKVSGRAYEDYLEREVLQPLGMGGARLRWSPDVERRMARGYQDGAAIAYQPIYHRPAGNLMASPRELAALVRLLLDRGRPLVAPASLARMERSETAWLRGTDIDYGLGIYGDVSGPVLTRGHDGGIDGFISSYRYAPAHGVGYVVLLNSTDWGAGRAMSRIGPLMLAFLLADRAPPPPLRPAPVPDERLAGWAGTYRAASPRNQLFGFLEAIGPRVLIVHRPGRLVAQRQGGDADEIDLVPLGGDRFALPGNSGSSVAFGRDVDGRRALRGGIVELVEEPPALAAVAYYGSRAVLVVLATALFIPFFHGVDTRRHLVPFASSLAFFSVPQLFMAGARARALGEVNWYTIAIFALSLAFAALSAACAGRALHFMARPNAWAIRAYSVVFAVAACAATLFLAYHHIIGLRLWRW